MIAPHIRRFTFISEKCGLYLALSEIFFAVILRLYSVDFIDLTIPDDYHHSQKKADVFITERESMARLTTARPTPHPRVGAVAGAGVERGARHRPSSRS